MFFALNAHVSTIKSCLHNEQPTMESCSEQEKKNSQDNKYTCVIYKITSQEEVKQQQQM